VRRERCSRRETYGRASVRAVEFHSGSRNIDVDGKWRNFSFLRLM
jgi:hypothetical protein